MTIHDVGNTMRRMAVAGMAVVLCGCATFLGKDPPADNRAVFELLWNDTDRRYALLEVKDIDWNAVYRDFGPRVTNDLGEEDFFSLMSEMLGVLDDKHMRLQSRTRSFNTGNWGSTSDAFSLSVVRRAYLRDARDTSSGMFTYGWLDDAVGYVYLRAFHYGGTGLATAQNWAREIDVVLEELQGARAIVFDDRNNLGGLPGNVDTVASRFADQERVYALIRTKSGPGPDDFTDPVSYYIRPEGPRQFTRPVVLLTNGITISGGEWFTLAMRSLPHVVHAGSPTAGAFSLSLERQLPNGWVYSMSVQKVTDTQGICYEGPGISPSPENLSRNTPEDLERDRDPQLEAARELALSLASGG